MNLDQKKTFVTDIKQRFEEAPLIIFTDFIGSTVDEMNAFRRACEPEGIHLQVVKNTLCRRALEGTEQAGLVEHLRGNVAVLFSGEDPIAAAKLMRAQLKANEKLQVKTGFFEGDVLDSQAVLAVADLPSREEHLVKLLQTLQQSPRLVLGVIQGPARDLLYLLRNYANTLEE